MQYDLIKDNKIIQTATFVLEEIPAPSDKGVWLERVDIMPDGFDGNFHTMEEVHTITTTQSITSRDLVYLPIEQIKGNLERTIDRDTEQSILSIGSVNKQRTITALSVKLARKEANGTITADELVELDSYEALFASIEDLLIAGREKIANINREDITIEELVAELPKLVV